MLTPKLQDVIAHAQQLPSEAQDALADEITELLEERAWSILFADPRSPELLQQMADAAIKEHIAGLTEDCG